MTSLDKSLAHSVGTLFEDAVSAPPLPATLAQATCGVFAMPLVGGTSVPTPSKLGSRETSLIAAHDR
ncbi:hypothetical protein [Xanthomonas indica]|uniref:hypothetical protein n=1 Tax=Xanthomonas indica TaxID=2912242 RepID=UPI003390159E